MIVKFNQNQQKSDNMSIKPGVVLKLGEVVLHADFYDRNGVLCLPHKPVPFKFCGVCGDRLLSDKAKLRRHYDRHHKEIDFDAADSNCYL